MRVGTVAASVLCIALFVSSLSGSSASAAVIHSYLCQITGKAPGSLTECNLAGSATPAGGFEAQAVLVDNFSGGSTAGDIYVNQSSSAGKLFDRFLAGGAYECQVTGLGSSATEPTHECDPNDPGFGGFTSTFAEGTVDPSNGNVWIPDFSAQKLDQFNSAGKYLSPQIAVPNGGPIEVSLDAAGDLFVAKMGRLPSENAISECSVASTPPCSAFTTFTTGADTVNGTFGRRAVAGVAVDTSKSSIKVYVADIAHNVIDRFSSTGVFECQITGLGSSATDLTHECDSTDVGTPTGAFGTLTFGGLGIDPTNGEIYVVDQTNKVVDEVSPAGAFVSQISIPNSGTPSKVAVRTATHDVYVADIANNVVDVFNTIVAPDVRTQPAVAVRGTGEGTVEVALNGEVNPDSAGPAKCWFAWVSAAAFGNTTPCSADIPNGAGWVKVHATIAVRPDTTYFFRLEASNANGTNEGTPSQNQSFSFGPGINEQWSTAASADAATLHASLNPNGAPTSYYFQYGTSSKYGSEEPAAPGTSIGSDTGDVQVEQHIHDLASNTVYHYRVVAVSELVPGSVETFYGPDETFTTQPLGEPLQLLDGRQWELVSPPDKHGAMLREINEAGLIQAAAGGGAITYWALGTTEAKPQGSPVEVQLLSTRGAGGWVAKDIATPHDAEITFTPGGGPEYRFFSPDLSLSLVEPRGAFTPLTGEMFPEATERTPYVRHNSTCEAEPATCYEPLVTGAGGYEDVPAGTKFGGNPPGYPVLAQGAVIFWGATPDLSHVVLKPSIESQLNLTSPPVKNALYEWSAAAPPTERLQLVSVLPDGTESASSGLGYDGKVIRHAISDDGSRIFFSSEVAGEEGLYMRDTATPTRKSVRLDVVQPGSEETQRIAETPNPRFQTATVDIATVEGTRAFFTDSQRLTANAGKAGSDLYECVIVETAGKLECELTDLTPEVAGERAEVQGAVIGTSEDGSYVYFVANGAFDGGAVHGTCGPYATASDACNLYMSHYDGEPGAESWEAPKPIAVLSGVDKPSWAGHSGSNLEELTSRVSPDGHRLAFMSQRSLTGYDNRDANSGIADEEVFLYYAPAGSGEGKLVCASCDPTGARPVGIEAGRYPRLIDGKNVWEESIWLAANIPGWTPFTGGTAAYQSRYLSDDGRLFFNSSDALVPQDINGNEDVYQYEPEGVGGCTSSSLTFSESSGGCVDLVSSGTASGESAFLDASESGNDVFFLTAAKLVPQDYDTALDVYDAHVCSAASPCIAPAVSTPACTTTDSCRAAPVQQPSVFGLPPSATFSGAGNLAPPSKQVVKPKALTRAQKLAQALKVCHKKKNRKKRTVCERQARTRYGAKSSRKATASKGGRR